MSINLRKNLLLTAAKQFITLSIICVLSFDSFDALAFDASTWPRDAPLPGRSALTGTLDNGVRYAIEHRSVGYNDDKAYIVVLVQTGSIYETDTQAGYAHLVEHILFRGSKGQSSKKTDKFFRKMGVSAAIHGQGATYLDRTVYSLGIPEDPRKNVPTAIQILAARVGAPLFKQDDVVAEKDIVLSEEQTSRRSPAQVQRAAEYLGADHPMVTRLPIGTRESLSAANQTELRAFYDHWYRPDRMIVVASGDFEPERIEKTIKRHFGRLRQPKSDNPLVRRIESPSGRNVVIVEDPKVKVRSVGLTLFRDRDVAYSMGAMKARMTENLGTSVMRNRLADYRTQTGYVTSLGTGFGRRNLDFQSDDFNMATEDGYELQVLNEVVDILTTGMDKGFTATEIDIAKQLTLKGFERAVEQEERTVNPSIANQWVEAIRYGHEAVAPSVVSAAGRVMLSEITPTEIHQALIARFDVSRVALVMSVPEGEQMVADVDQFSEALSVLMEHEVSSVELSDAEGDASETQDAFALNDLALGTVLEERTYKDIDTTHLRLSNNAHVLFKKNLQENTQVMIRVRSPGGLSLLADYDAVRTNLARDTLLASGIRGLKGSAIGNVFNLHRTSVSVVLGESEHGYIIRTTPEELEFALRILHIMFTEVDIDDEAFAAMQAKNRTSLAGYIATPQYQYGSEVEEVLAPGRKLNSINLRPEMLDQATPEWVESSFKLLLEHAGGTYFVISGPLNWQDVKPQVEKYIGSLPGGKPRVAGDVAYPFAKSAAEIRRHINPDERSVGRIYFVEPNPGYDDQMSYVRFAYGNILTQRLFKEVREEKGLVYQINAGASSPSYPRPHGQVVISYVADPSKVSEIEDDVLKVMRGMTEGIKNSDLKPIQKMMARGFTDSLDKPEFTLGMVYDRLVQDQPLLSSEDFLGYIDALDKTMVMDYARKVVEDLVVVKTEYSPAVTTSEEAGASQ